MTELDSEILLETEESAEDTMRGKFLVFELDEQEFAIAIEYVVDIINVQPVTRVPNCPEYVRGITNLRGKVIPILDVRLRFGKPAREYDGRTCIIVVEERGVTVGLVIDSVTEVITLEDERISTPPSFHGGGEVRFVKGIGKTENGIKLLLDCHAVLSDELPGPDPAEEEFPE